MREREIEKILRDTLKRLGVEVRSEPMEYGTGGFCRLDEEPMVVIPPDLARVKRIELFLYALRRLDTSGIYLPPVIRELIEGNENEPDI